jgi:hypothetical protein
MKIKIWGKDGAEWETGTITSATDGSLAFEGRDFGKLATYYADATGLSGDELLRFMLTRLTGSQTTYAELVPDDPPGATKSVPDDGERLDLMADIIGGLAGEMAVAALKEEPAK